MRFSCTNCDNELYDRTSYSALISPQTNAINIGDTLNFSSINSSLFELEFTNQSYDNSNAPISFKLALFKVEASNQDASSAREQFELIPQIGELSFRDIFENELIMHNDCADEVCQFSLDLVPMVPGYYGIQLKYGVIQTQDECTSISLQPFEIVSNGNNFEICQEINTIRFRLDGSFYTNPGDDKNFYFFKVQE